MITLLESWTGKDAGLCMRALLVLVIGMLKQTGIAQGFQSWIGLVLKPVPITPDMLTAASVLLAIAGFFSFTYGKDWLGVALFFLAFAFDALDGAVARAKGIASSRGAFLDGVADRFVEFFIILALFSAGLPGLAIPSQYWLFALLFFGTCMTAFVKAYADHRGVLSHERAVSMRGLFERAERTIIIFIASVFVALSLDFYATVAVAVAAALSVLTVIQRIAESLS